jgi:hypothetical protein
MQSYGRVLAWVSFSPFFGDEVVPMRCFMRRSLVGSLAGAGVGFVVGYVGVCITTGGQTARDTGAVILFVGSFLAGTGAIAGAVIGGVADLREFFQTKEQASDRNDLS